jgi:hypothetical protein
LLSRGLDPAGGGVSAVDACEASTDQSPQDAEAQDTAAQQHAGWFFTSTVCCCLLLSVAVCCCHVVLILQEVVLVLWTLVRLQPISHLKMQQHRTLLHNNMLAGFSQVLSVAVCCCLLLSRGLDPAGGGVSAVDACEASTYQSPQDAAAQDTAAQQHAGWFFPSTVCCCLLLSRGLGPAGGGVSAVDACEAPTH